MGGHFICPPNYQIVIDNIPKSTANNKYTRSYETIAKTELSAINSKNTAKQWSM